MSAPAVTRWIYDFSEGSREMRELLGGKGAGIAEMTKVLGPDVVPAGFTITTAACVAYMHADRTAPEGLDEGVDEALARLEALAGRRLGDASDPLLLSVRSGARDSMPGMMDTVLNLGLNDDSVRGLAASTGNERFAWDSYRRLVQMFGNVVCGVRGARPTRASSSRARSRRSSTPGAASAPSPTGGSTASPTTGGRASTSSRWSSATAARARAPAWRSRATRSRARPSRAATTS
jgi:hypothetical protein